MKGKRGSTISEFKASDAKYPFLDRTSKVILANLVTTEAGTGAVLIAPGHGAEDYVAGQQNGLGVLSPVNDEGYFTEEVGLAELVGQHVFKSNGRIIEILAESGHLLGQEEYHHSYPLCWRSKTPIAFRAVEQFFISLDTLRSQVLEEIDKVKWMPAWSRNRIYGTFEARPRLVYLVPTQVRWYPLTYQHSSIHRDQWKGHLASAGSARVSGSKGVPGTDVSGRLKTLRKIPFNERVVSLSVGSGSGPGPGSNRYLRVKDARMSMASWVAKAAPMQIRGPCPKGM